MEGHRKTADMGEIYFMGKKTIPEAVKNMEKKFNIDIKIKK